jgi:hypothetical protein
MSVLAAAKGPKGLDDPHLQPVVHRRQVVLIWIRARAGVPDGCVRTSRLA